MLGVIFLLPLVALIFGNVFLGWDHSSLGLLIFAIPAACYGYYRIRNYSVFDADRLVYDTMLDMFRAYPDDWNIEVIKDKQNYRVGMGYELHDKIKITVDERPGKEGEVRIKVTDPEDGGVLHYAPGLGYAKQFRRKIGELHLYREMKTMVNVAMFADENKSSLPKAREALEKFREEKNLQTGDAA